MSISALKVNAGEIMSSPPIVVSETTPLKEAATLLIDNRIGCLPVVDEMGRLTGVVTERTFQAQIAGVRPDSAMSRDQRVLEELYIDGSDSMNDVREAFIASYSKPVSQVMLGSPPTLSRDTPLWKVADELLRTHLSHLVVVLEGKPIGVVARHDLLRAYANG